MSDINSEQKRQLRETALSHAVGINLGADYGSEKILRDAEEFYQFLLKDDG